MWGFLKTFKNYRVKFIMNRPCLLVRFAIKVNRGKWKELPSS